MRVLHVITDTNIGGAGRYLLYLLTQPAFREHEVFVACPDGELGGRLDALGIERIPISGRDISFSLPLTTEFFRVLRRIRPDVVHTHSSFSGRLASKALGIPVVYTKHNLVRIPSLSGAVPPKPGPLKRLGNRLTATLLSDKIIAVSEGVYRDLLDSGVPASRVVTIPNGIELSPFEGWADRWAEHFRKEPRRKPGEKAGETPGRKAGGKPGEKPGEKTRAVRIGTVARLHPQKALHVLVDAAKLVVRSYPEVRFIIGGTGPCREALKTQIKELRLEPYVEMPGFIADVPEFLRGLDIYALSSAYEGLALAVLEAMAAGLPVVATSVGGVPEAVVHEETGFLVPAGDSRLMAQAIVRLIVDPDLAQKMGLAGRKRVERFFDAKIMAEKTVAVYEDIYRKKPGRSRSRACLPE